MNEIKIQKDYWSGSKCVENQVPWMVPGSIHLLDKLCLPEDRVLEVGTGGSTFFFARRCKQVVAIETNYDWYSKIESEIEKIHFKNITYLYCNKQEDIELMIQSLEKGFTIISIDSIFGYNRSKFLDVAIEQNKGLGLRVVVLDNFADSALFPEHYNLSVEEMGERCKDTNEIWEGKDFLDNWVGKGTRVLNCI